MADDSKPNRVNVPGIIHSKWNKMYVPYDNIAAKFSKIYRDSFERPFKSKYDKEVNPRDFASRLESVELKLRWATKSLAYLLETYQGRIGSFDIAMTGMSKPIPEDFAFHTDVFFIFAYSALDIVGGLIDTVIETNIEKRDVSFATVLDFLCSRNNPFRVPAINELKTENDKGWILEFRQYRNFVIHHSIIRPHSQFHYSAREKMVEINPIMLPDDPNKIPLCYEEKRYLAPYCQEVLTKELDTMEALLGFVDRSL